MELEQPGRWLVCRQEHFESRDRGAGTISDTVTDAAAGADLQPVRAQRRNVFALHDGRHRNRCQLGQLSRGLFGALNVQPTGAEWYRSQVTPTGSRFSDEEKYERYTHGAPRADNRPSITTPCIPPARDIRTARPFRQTRRS